MMHRGYALLFRSLERIRPVTNRFRSRADRSGGRRWQLDDRGDVPGWVLVTLMTAGLVLTLWAVASPRLEEVFNHAIDTVVGGP